MFRHFMRFVFIALAAVAAALAASPARAALGVVATTPDLAAIAQAVAGGRAKVRALALPTQDPHWVDARPNLALELSKADLLLAVGAELELGWLPTLQVGSRNGAVQVGAKGLLDCSELVDLLERPTGKVDRARGDIHPSGNPHYLLDPRAAERVAVGIGKRLAELDPSGRSEYLENTKRFVGALREARKRWEAKLAPARGREVIAFHRSLAYLANWLGLQVVDHIEAKPGIPPNPRHVADVIQRGKERRVTLVLQEAWYPSTTSELVAQKIGAKFVKLPGSANFSAGQGYVAFLDGVVNRIASAL